MYETITGFEEIVNLSEALYLVIAACASSTLLNSANPYLQLSLDFRSRTRSTRRSEPSLAPTLESFVVEETLVFLAIWESIGGVVDLVLYNLLTAWAKI